jgi:hypothetical protein
METHVGFLVFELTAVAAIKGEVEACLRDVNAVSGLSAGG